MLVYGPKVEGIEADAEFMKGPDLELLGRLAFTAASSSKTAAVLAWSEPASIKCIDQYTIKVSVARHSVLHRTS